MLYCRCHVRERAATVGVKEVQPENRGVKEKLYVFKIIYIFFSSLLSRHKAQ